MDSLLEPHPGLLGSRHNLIQIPNPTIQGPNMDSLLEPHPRVRQWMADVRSATAPHYEDAHRGLVKVAARFAQMRQQRQSRL